MGDRSPKEKMKKQKQHEKEHIKIAQQKQENMVKNRKDHGQQAEAGEPIKKAG